MARGLSLSFLAAHADIAPVATTTVKAINANGSTTLSFLVIFTPPQG
jgi:hypothetical protein